MEEEDDALAAALGEAFFSGLATLGDSFFEKLFCDELKVKALERRLSAGFGIVILGPVRLEGEVRDSLRVLVVGVCESLADAFLGETRELFLEPLLELVRELNREARRLRLGDPPSDTVFGVRTFRFLEAAVELRKELLLALGEGEDRLLRFSLPGLEIFAMELR
mmetsp:Transcript_31252/g.43486  ORF Transcript_31252/g.43486 Transcript_31252/m.43486 type:complete len:165 (+) Transcript_31252:612-1106(+)